MMRIAIPSRDYKKDAAMIVAVMKIGVNCQDHDCDHTPATTHVPPSIDTGPIVPPWMYASVDDYDYYADRDDDDKST